jgi:hypothetical protein
MIKFSLTIILFLFGSVLTFAQGNWGGGVDDENLHFGFTFQYIGSEYKIQKKVDWREPQSGDGETESLKSISSSVHPGFGLGFVSNLYLTKHLDLRFTPTLVFADRVVDYEFLSAKTYEQDAVPSPEGLTRRAVASTMVEFPLLLKLKSDRRGNFRAYLVGGAKYGMDIVSKKKADDGDKVYFAKYLKNKKNILSYEVGIGFDLYFDYFKLSPEIKLSNSFNSVLKPDLEPYSNPIEKLFLRNFIFSLYFE